MTQSAGKPRTLAEKVWDSHVVVPGEADAVATTTPT